MLCRLLVTTYHAARPGLATRRNVSGPGPGGMAALRAGNYNTSLVGLRARGYCKESGVPAPPHPPRAMCHAQHGCRCFVVCQSGAAPNGFSSATVLPEQGAAWRGGVEGGGILAGSVKWARGAG